MKPTLVSVSGFSSDVGKTTVLCQLLRLIPGWEAIKITRGHYRSCGKNPEVCCVSSLLGEHAHVISDEHATRVAGKDTGRFWEAGASMVHWVIGATHQIEEGLSVALDRVRAEGVFIEGASFLKYLEADYSVMVAAPAASDIKSSALRVMREMDALVINRSARNPAIVESLQYKLAKRGVSKIEAPVYFESDLPLIADEIRTVHFRRFADSSSEKSQP